MVHDSWYFRSVSRLRSPPSLPGKCRGKWSGWFSDLSHTLPRYFDRDLIHKRNYHQTSFRACEVCFSGHKTTRQASLRDFLEMHILLLLGKGSKKKRKKKLTNVSFMYVCVAGNGEMLVFFSFFPPTIV